MEEIEVKKLNPNAMISFTRVNGSDMRLCGSELGHNSVISMKVSECAIHPKGSGGLYYHPGNRHIVVEMSSVQFAELISNMNSSGVPCTLKELGRLRAPEVEKPKPSIERYAKKIDGTGLSIIRSLRDLKCQSFGILPKNTSKKNREVFDSAIDRAIQDIRSNLKFYVDMHKEELERMTGEASSEIEAIIQHKLTQLGMQKMHELGGVSALFKENGAALEYEEVIE